MKRNIWFDGMMGVIVGDALGCPVQFMSREEIAGRAAGPVNTTVSSSCNKSQILFIIFLPFLQINCDIIITRKIIRT